jgi:hypothetical protein
LTRGASISFEELGPTGKSAKNDTNMVAAKTLLDNAKAYDE